MTKVYWVFWGALLLWAPTQVMAADYYRYQDDNGRWVFTDKRPSGDTAKSAQKETLLVTESSTKANVVNRGSRERPKLVAVNPLAGPVQFWLEITASNNMRVSAAKPHEWIVPGQTEQVLTTLEKRNINKGWSYQWNGQMALGMPIDRTQYQPEPLALPFRGGPFGVSQAFHGAASHDRHVQSHYAVDIVMPKGTPILASRAGVVMDVERDFTRSGWSDSYADEANFVRLLHADGAMTVYAHLDPDSIPVGIGQPVVQGELIGHSGTTGYSTGPHLHFALQINAGKALVSIPFTFEKVGEPLEGMILQGPLERRATSHRR